ncbi:hypothetical protein L208DRAFT_1319087 [Tricholoma matsutake]|nr:hypothetical protein L208DRAFT_1319087 [Tricholoma matsutake 945]
MALQRVVFPKSQSKPTAIAALSTAPSCSAISCHCSAVGHLAPVLFRTIRKPCAYSLKLRAKVTGSTNSKYQAVACTLIFRQGEQIDCIVSASGRRTPPEVKLFALQLRVSAACSKGCKRLVIFSAVGINSLIDPKPRSGQIFALDACRALCPWLAGDKEQNSHDRVSNSTRCCRHGYNVPLTFKWGVHKKAHDVTTSTKISMGRCPRMSLDYLKAQVDKGVKKDWHAQFVRPAYCGWHFLHLNGVRGKPVLPSTHKGGPWLKVMGTSTTTTSRLTRLLTGHAPLGEYRQ